MAVCVPFTVRKCLSKKTTFSNRLFYDLKLGILSFYGARKNASISIKAGEA